MLVIHWSKHKNTADILKNGIRPKTRKNEDAISIKGVWCFPYTRNKMLNHNWKRNLKLWRGDNGNFNGFVFKLEKHDFPIMAGSFALVGAFPRESLFETYEDFVAAYGNYFNPTKMNLENPNSETDYLDYQDFELILIKHIDPARIIKVIKDREPLKKVNIED